MPTLRVLSCALLLALGLAAAPVAAGAPVTAGAAAVRLEIEAPPELEGVAARLAATEPAVLERLADLVGLVDPGPPIQVALAPESSSVAQQTPSWVSGFAYGELGRVVLLPERTPSYPDGSLEEVLYHEIAHVLIHRAAGGREVPRWFNEGLAMAAAGTWSVDDRSRLTLALLFEDRRSLDELEARFRGESGEVHRAYALSGAMVRELLRVVGRERVAGILARRAVGLSFEQAFRRSAGVTLARFEDTFWKRYSLWYRWVPIISSSFTLWIAITLLALWATHRKRQRTKALEAQWEAEERFAEVAEERFAKPGEASEPTIH